MKKTACREEPRRCAVTFAGPLECVRDETRRNRSRPLPSAASWCVAILGLALERRFEVELTKRGRARSKCRCSCADQHGACS